MTVVEGESILIVCSDDSAVAKLKKDLGIEKDSLIRLETKYYKSSIPVTVVDRLTEKPHGSVRGIILINCPQFLSLLTDEDEDIIKILYTSSCDAIDACIEAGFELVLSEPSHPEDSETDFGAGRIKKALECRMWSKTVGSSPEKVLADFDDLMHRIKIVRDSALSQNGNDDLRRARAAAAALELAALLADEEDSD